MAARAKLLPNDFLSNRKCYKGKDVQYGGGRNSMRTLIPKLRHITHWQHRKWSAICIGKFDLLAAGLRNTVPRRTVMFYPDRPLPYTAIYKICHLANCTIVDRKSATFDQAVYWRDATIRSADELVERLNLEGRFINGRCADISKTRVGKVFERVFQYSLAVDPKTFRGQCVCKSDLNAAHNGRVVVCPIQRAEEGLVYQVVVDNSVGDEVEDMRIAVMKDALPLAYLKRRPRSDRFSNTNTSARVENVANLLSPEEVNRVLKFCRLMGLDYGEIDTLRDRESGRLYIVDVNSTPFGPPNHLPKREGRRAMQILADSFREQFLKS